MLAFLSTCCVNVLFILFRTPKACKAQRKLVNDLVPNPRQPISTGLQETLKPWLLHCSTISTYLSFLNSFATLTFSSHGTVNPLSTVVLVDIDQMTICDIQQKMGLMDTFCQINRSSFLKNRDRQASSKTIDKTLPYSPYLSHYAVMSNFSYWLSHIWSHICHSDFPKICFSTHIGDRPFA